MGSKQGRPSARVATLWASLSKSGQWKTPPFSKSYYYSQFLGFPGNSVWKFSTAAPLPPVIFPHEILKSKTNPKDS
jgi:hypothetical protein